MARMRCTSQGGSDGTPRSSRDMLTMATSSLQIGIAWLGEGKGREEGEGEGELEERGGVGREGRERAVMRF